MKNGTFVCTPSLEPTVSPGAPKGEEFEEALQQTQRMANRWAQRMPLWMDREAFLGEARLALVVAARSYRVGRGLPFPDYARICVRRALVREAQRQDPAGRSRRGRIRGGQEEAVRADLPPLSYELCVQRGASGLIPAEIDPAPGPEARVLWGETLDHLYAALRTLRRRDRYVLYLRYWEGQPRSVVAATLGISSQRIHHIERRVMRHLRERMPDEETVTLPYVR